LMMVACLRCRTKRSWLDTMNGGSELKKYLSEIFLNWGFGE